MAYSKKIAKKSIPLGHLKIGPAKAHPCKGINGKGKGKGSKGKGKATITHRHYKPSSKFVLIL